MRRWWGKWLLVGLLAVAVFAGCREVADSSNYQSEIRPSVADVISATIFSPDGKKAIIFRDRGPAILDFSAKQEMPFPSGDFSSAAAWSPDNRYIAIGKKTKESLPQLGILDTKTLDWKPIKAGSKTPLAMSNFPTWSPDGRRMVFEGLAEDPIELFVVYLYEVSSGKCIAQEVGNIYKSGNPFWQDRIIFSCLSGWEPPGYKYLRRRFYSSLPTKNGGKDQREILPDAFIEEMSAAPDSPYAAALCREDMANPAAYPQVEYTLYLVSDAKAPVAKKLCSGKFVEGRGKMLWSAKGEELLMGLRDASDNPRKTRIIIVSAKTGEITKLTDREGKTLYGGVPQWVDGDKAICYSFLNAAKEFELWRYERARKETRRIYPFQQ